MTNKEFGRRVGCSESMASRLRKGRRRPGSDLRDNIIRVFEFNRDLDTLNEVMDASRSAETFGAFLRANVFMDEEPVAAVA